MFIKTGVLKRLCKEAYKRGELYIERNEKYFSIAGIGWQMEVKTGSLSKKVKSILVELTGDLPQTGEGYRYAEKETPQGLIDECIYKNMAAVCGYSEYIATNIIIAGPQGPRNVMQNMDTGEKAMIAMQYLCLIDRTAIDADNGETPVDNPILTDNNYFLWQNNIMSLTCMNTPVVYAKEKQLIDRINNDDMTWEFTEDYLIGR